LFPPGNSQVRTSASGASHPSSDGDYRLPIATRHDIGCAGREWFSPATFASRGD